MKIAFFNYFQNLNNRGAETYVRSLSDFLSLRHQTKIFSATKNAPHPTTTHRADFLHRLFLTPFDFHISFWAVRQLKYLTLFNPDVVICLHAGWPALMLRLWTWFNHKKLVIPGQSGPGWYDRINLLVHPDLFVCLTRNQLAWAKRALHWPSQKFAVIPNGVDLKIFKPSSVKLHLNLNKPIILASAASTPAKRLDTTIKAVARLKNASLVILGSGPLDRNIDSLGNSLLGEKRFLHLSVAHRDMPAYYQTADLFTLASDSSEAFGIVYLEALASGLPIVATLDASRREIIGNAGLFVRHPHHTSHYALKLEAALSRRWKNLPRKQAQRFNWDSISQAYEKELAAL